MSRKILTMRTGYSICRDRWVLQAGWWRSGGTEKTDYVLVEAEGMDGGATAVELYLGGDGWMLGRVMH